MQNLLSQKAIRDVIMKLETTLDAVNEHTVTLSNYIRDHYIDYLKLKRTKTENFKRDLGVLKIISAYPIAHKALSEITLLDLEELLLKIQKDRGVSEATINRYRSQLQAIFNHAIKKSVINVNPVNNIKRYKEVPRDIALTYQEAERLLCRCQESANKELYYVVLIALYTGMRYNEVLQMKKDRLIGNRYYLKANETKSRKDRTVIIHVEAKEMLNKFICTFPNDTDRIFMTNYIKRSFGTALRKAGLEGTRFHDLRRTFATFLMGNGTHASIIQRQLGHSSLRMTELYLSTNLNKSIDEIDKICFKGGSGHNS